jgi:hypothetical protein
LSIACCCCFFVEVWWRRRENGDKRNGSGSGNRNVTTLTRHYQDISPIGNIGLEVSNK